MRATDVPFFLCVEGGTSLDTRTVLEGFALDSQRLVVRVVRCGCLATD